MTEEEAKTKTCLQTLAPINDGLGGVIYGASCCIASDCMAWRWRGHRFTASYGTKRSGHLVDDNSPDHNLRTPTPAALARYPLDHVGFCGLAGAA